MTGGDVADVEQALTAARELRPEDVAAPGLGSAEIGQGASRVAAYESVRAALLPFQRRFAHAGRGGVLAGRDIGTVVCPDAQAKLFVTASREERARRRHEELRKRSDRLNYEQVLSELDERDRRDAQRAVAPLRAATDAFVLDTTRLDVGTALQAALAFVRTIEGRAPDAEQPL